MILTLLCLLYIFLLWDIRLRISYLLHARRDYGRFHRVQVGGARLVLAAAQTYTGFRLIVENSLGGALPPRFLVLSNHQSLADIPILTYVFSSHIVGFVAKRELRRGLPSVSVALRKGKHALINRSGEFQTARRELVRLARSSADGICPVVFPEGTRSRSGRVGRFHSAAVRTILDEAALPIVSVAVDGGYKIAALKGLLRKLPECVYRVKLLSLYPIATERGQVMEILQKTYREISEQIEQWRKTES